MPITEVVIVVVVQSIIYKVNVTVYEVNVEILPTTSNEYVPTFADNAVWTYIKEPLILITAVSAVVPPT